jgi:hypothetical protein
MGTGAGNDGRKHGGDKRKNGDEKRLTGMSPEGDVYPNTSQEADGIVVGARPRMAIGVSPL